MKKLSALLLVVLAACAIASAAVAQSTTVAVDQLPARTLSHVIGHDGTGRAGREAVTDFVKPGSTSPTAGNVVTWGTSGNLITDGGKPLPSGAIVGTTDAQILSNKTLPSPLISSPVVSGSGTYSGTSNFTGPLQAGGVTQTFPASGSLAGTTDPQTLANKALSGATSIDTASFNVTNAPGALKLGNQSPTPGSTMGISYSWEPSTNSYPCTNEGGVWSGGGSYSFLCLNQTFTSSTVGSQGAGPLATLFSFANANGATGDIVAVLGDTVLRQSGGSAFGANFIARTAAGVSGVLRGLELDVEPASGTMATSGSGGLFINAFSSQVQGAAIQMGGLSGGTFQNGMICAAVDGACVASQTGQTSSSLINSSAGTYTKAPVVLGTGSGQAIAFGTGAVGVSPYMWGGSAGNIILQLGSGGSFIIENPSGTTEVTLDQFGRVTATAINLPSITPASSSASCTSGDIARDTNYVYVCVSANTWKRSALSTW